MLPCRVALPAASQRASAPPVRRCRSAMTACRACTADERRPPEQASVARWTASCRPPMTHAESTTGLPAADAPCSRRSPDDRLATPNRLLTPERREDDADVSLRPQVLAEFIGQRQARANLQVF